VRIPIYRHSLARLAETLARFIECEQVIDSPEATKPTPGDDPDSLEEPEP